MLRSDVEQMWIGVLQLHKVKHVEEIAPDKWETTFVLVTPEDTESAPSGLPTGKKGKGSTLPKKTRRAKGSAKTSAGDGAILSVNGAIRQT